MTTHHRFRFQIVTGLVVTLLIAASVFWLQRWRIGSRSQRLIEMGILVQKGDFGDVVQINYWPREISTDELRQLQHYPRLSLLNLDNVPIADEDVAVLKSIPALETLLLSGSRVTDDCMPTLAEFETLQRVSISRTAVTRAGVLRLKQLRPDLQIDYNALEINGLGHLVAYQGHGSLNDQLQLIDLDLRDAEVTDDDLRPVALCSQLRMINLSGTKISDVGISHLRPLKYLQELWLTATGVSDDGLKEIGRFSSLKVLSVAETRISDRSLAELANLEKLQTLHIGSTNITDSGVRKLKGLRALKALHVSKSAVTKAAAAELKTANPALQVFGGSEPEKPIRDIESRVLG